MTRLAQQSLKQMYDRASLREPQKNLGSVEFRFMIGRIARVILVNPRKALFEVGVIPSIVYFMSRIRKSKYLTQHVKVCCCSFLVLLIRFFVVVVVFFLIILNLFYFSPY